MVSCQQTHNDRFGAEPFCINVSRANGLCCNLQKIQKFVSQPEDFRKPEGKPFSSASFGPIGSRILLTVVESGLRGHSCRGGFGDVVIPVPTEEPELEMLIFDRQVSVSTLQAAPT